MAPVLRLRSPLFALALILSFLPWIEIRCTHPERGEIVISQTGVQSTYGGHSITINGKSPEDANIVANNALPQGAPGANRDISMAPLIWLFLASLAVGLGAALFVVDERQRWIICTTAGSVALGTLILQTAVGFPMTANIPRGEQGGWNFTAWFWIALACTFGTIMVSLVERMAKVQTTTATAEVKATAPATPLHSGSTYVPPS